MRAQAALRKIPGALGSVALDKSTLKKLFFTTLAAAALILIGHAWLGTVVASLVVS